MKRDIVEDELRRHRKLELQRDGSSSAGEHLPSGSVCGAGSGTPDKPEGHGKHAKAGKGGRDIPDTDGRDGADVNYAHPPEGDKYPEEVTQHRKLKVGYGLYLMGMMDIDRYEQYMASDEKEPDELATAMAMANHYRQVRK
jgi:hypothetical protein